jgi:hypothetical protein
LLYMPKRGFHRHLGVLASWGPLEKEIHPVMAVHITMTWMVAYNLYNMAFDSCSMTWEQHQQRVNVCLSSGKVIEYKRTVNGTWLPTITIQSKRGIFYHNHIVDFCRCSLETCRIESLEEFQFDKSANWLDEDCHSRRACLDGYSDSIMTLNLPSNCFKAIQSWTRHGSSWLTIRNGVELREWKDKRHEVYDEGEDSRICIMRVRL